MFKNMEKIPLQTLRSHLARWQELFHPKIFFSLLLVNNMFIYLSTNTVKQFVFENDCFMVFVSQTTTKYIGTQHYKTHLLTFINSHT